MSSQCVFCRNNIHPHATVCGCCGAFISSPLRVNGPQTGLFLIFLWGNYLFFGPGMIVVAFVDKTAPFAPAFMVGLVITIVGYLSLAKLSRWFNRPLWYRR